MKRILLLALLAALLAPSVASANKPAGCVEGICQDEAVAVVTAAENAAGRFPATRDVYCSFQVGDWYCHALYNRKGSYGDTSYYGRLVDYKVTRNPDGTLNAALIGAG